MQSTDFSAAFAFQFTPGTRVVLKNSHTMAAAEGTKGTVGPRGYFSVWNADTGYRWYVDIIWDRPEAGHQEDGGYWASYFEPVKKLSVTPQARQVLQMIQQTGRITGVQAWNVLKVRSLSRRITELKQAGYDIKRSLKVDHLGQRYAEYSLAA